MSHENVELFKKALAAYNQRDIEAMLEIWHPEAVWYPFTAQVEGDDAYHGQGASGSGGRTWTPPSRRLRRVLKTFGTSATQSSHWASFAPGSEAASPLDTEIGWLTRYRDGLALWGRAYQSHAEALDAAGLSE